MVAARRGGGKEPRQRLADPNQPPYKPELLAKVRKLATNESNTDPAFFCKPGEECRASGLRTGISQSPGNADHFYVPGDIRKYVPHY